jgi:hypothetical protein
MTAQKKSRQAGTRKSTKLTRCNDGLYLVPCRCLACNSMTRSITCTRTCMRVWAVTVYGLLCMECSKSMTVRREKNQKIEKNVCVHMLHVNWPGRAHTDRLTLAVWIVTGATLCPGTAWNLGIQHPTHCVASQHASSLDTYESYSPRGYIMQCKIGIAPLGMQGCD